MATYPQFNAFSYAPDDPLALEHQAIERWIEEAAASPRLNSYSRDIDLKITPSGQKLLDADSVKGRRYVLAALAQMQHWDQQVNQFRRDSATGLGHAQVRDRVIC